MASMFRFSVKSFRFNFYKPCYGSYRYVSQSQKQVHTDLEKSNHYDLIIAGGGLVGTALACGIAKTKVLSDLKVLLLEGAPQFKGFTGGPYKNRVSAINHGSVELFKSIGAWEQIFSTRYKSVKQMQIWDASSDAMISFNHDNFSDDVACIIENDLMLHAILEQLKLSKNVTLLNMATIDNVKLRMNGSPKNVVTLKTGESMTCDLLVSLRRLPNAHIMLCVFAYNIIWCFHHPFLKSENENLLKIRSNGTSDHEKAKELDILNICLSEFFDNEKSQIIDKFKMKILRCD